MIVINKYKSEKIFIKRGSWKVQPPSMAAFVVAPIHIMLSVEEKMSGIVNPDDKINRIKLFVDDLKLFIKDLDVIGEVYDVICKFEKVSGSTLWTHRENNLWPA